MHALVGIIADVCAFNLFISFTFCVRYLMKRFISRHIRIRAQELRAVSLNFIGRCFSSEA